MLNISQMRYKKVKLSLVTFEHRVEKLNFTYRCSIGHGDEMLGVGVCGGGGGVRVRAGCLSNVEECVRFSACTMTVL